MRGDPHRSSPASGVAAASGHYDCHHVHANIDSPEAGTARASYCATIDSGSGWAMFVAPLLLAGLGFVIVRRRGQMVVAVACSAVALAILNAVLILFLNPSYNSI